MTPPMAAPRPSPLQLVLAAVIGVTVALPDWISVMVHDARGRATDLYAGLWGTSRARWDDMHVDLDIFGVAYLAFAVSIVGVVLLLRAGLGGQPAARVLAKKAMIATLVTMCLFVGRMLVETGVGLDWAGVVGPLAVVAALFTLRDAR